MGDTPLRFAVASAKECAARFTAADVPPRDLIGYGTALLRAQEWEPADAAFHRLLQLLANASLYQKARALYLIVDAYAGTTGQLSTALAYQAQLEALGSQAAPERMLGQLSIAERGRIADSLTLVETALTAARAASRAMTGDTAKHYAFTSAYVYGLLADLYVRRHQFDKAVATIVEGRNTLVPIRRSVLQVLGGAERRYQMLGQPAPMLTASIWYGADGAATVRPAHDVPSLVVFVQHTCGDRCYPGYAVLRRLYVKYASTGLQIVFVSRTVGSFNGDLVTPEREAELTRRYFVDSLALPPLTIALWKTPFEKRARDGRMMAQSTPNERAYQLNSSAPLPVYVVDRKGIIQAITSIVPDNEALLDHQLRLVSQQ